jgi:hypothetical protein
VLIAVLALAACASSAEAATLYALQAREVYVRNFRGAFVLGTAKGPSFFPVPGLSDTVLVQRYAHGRDWGYGLVGGRFPDWRGAHCGWVHLQRTRGNHHVKFVRRISTGHAAGCQRSGNELKEGILFKKGSYIAAAGAGSVYGAVIKPCPDAHAYGNYSPTTGQFKDPYPIPLPTGHGFSIPGFGQRYVTADGHAAMLKDSSHTPHTAPVAGPSGGPIWYFVHAECVDRLPTYIGSVRTKTGVCCELPGKGAQRPWTIFPKKDVVIGVRWRGWGGDVARGRGSLWHNTCKPTCLASNFDKRPATILLGRRRGGRSCYEPKAFFYTRLTVRWKRDGKAKQQRRSLEAVCANV